MDQEGTGSIPWPKNFRGEGEGGGFVGADPGEDIAEGGDLKIMGGGIAAEVEGGEAGGGSGGEVEAEGIADMKDGGGGASELAEGFLKGDAGGFGETDFGGDDEAGEVAIEAKGMEEGSEAFVPIGNDAEVEALGGEGFEGGENIVVEAPGGGLGEGFVEDGEEGLARGWGEEVGEGGIDDGGPIGAGVMEGLGLGPGLGESMVQELGIQSDPDHFTGDSGVDGADRGARAEEGASHIKGDRLDAVEAMHGGTREWGVGNRESGLGNGVDLDGVQGRRC
jgi:hypothetical protein